MQKRRFGDSCYGYADDSIREMFGMIAGNNKEETTGILAQILSKLVLEYANDDGEKSSINYVFFSQFEIPVHFLLQLITNPESDETDIQIGIRSLYIIYIVLRQVLKIENAKKAKRDARNGISNSEEFINIKKSVQYSSHQNESSPDELIYVPSFVEFNKTKSFTSVAYSISPYVLTIRKHEMIPLLTNLLKFPNRGIVQLTLKVLVLLCQISPRFIDDMSQSFIASVFFTVLNNIEYEAYPPYMDASSSGLIIQITNSISSTKRQEKQEVKELYISSEWIEGKEALLIILSDLIRYVSRLTSVCTELYDSGLFTTLWDLYVTYVSHPKLAPSILQSLVSLSCNLPDFSYNDDIPTDVKTMLVTNLVSTDNSIVSCSLYFIYRSIYEGTIMLWLDIPGLFEGILSVYTNNHSNDRILILDMFHRLFQFHETPSHCPLSYSLPPYSYSPGLYFIVLSQFFSFFNAHIPALYPSLALSFYLRCLRSFTPSYEFFNPHLNYVDNTNKTNIFANLGGKRSSSISNSKEIDSLTTSPSSPSGSFNNKQNNFGINFKGFQSKLFETNKQITQRNDTIEKSLYYIYNINKEEKQNFDKNRFLNKDSEPYKHILETVQKKYLNISKRIENIGSVQYYTTLNLYETEKDFEGRVSRCIYCDGNKEWKDRIFVITGRYLLEYNISDLSHLHKRYDIYNCHLSISREKLGKKKNKEPCIVISMNGEEILAFSPYPPFPLYLWYDVLLTITQNIHYLPPFVTDFNETKEEYTRHIEFRDVEYYFFGQLPVLPLDSLVDKQAVSAINTLMENGGIYGFSFIQRIIQMIQAPGYESVTSALYSKGLKDIFSYRDVNYKEQLGAYFKAKHDRNYVNVLLKKKSQFMYIQQVCKSFVEKTKNGFYIDIITLKTGDKKSIRQSIAIPKSDVSNLGEELYTRDIYICRNVDFGIPANILKMIESEKNDEIFRKRGDRGIYMLIIDYNYT
ncbi:hypothetical protein WA158_004235 [Blastocystis sp. Blastoise]